MSLRAMICMAGRVQNATPGVEHLLTLRFVLERLVHEVKKMGERVVDEA